MPVAKEGRRNAEVFFRLVARKRDDEQNAGPEEGTHAAPGELAGPTGPLKVIGRLAREAAVEHDVNESAGDEGLEERYGKGIELLDDDLTGREPDGCSCTDGKESGECRNCAHGPPHQPPDGEADGEAVQNDANTERGGSGIGVVVMRGRQGSAVDECVQEQGRQCEHCNHPVDTAFAAVHSVFQHLGGGQPDHGDRQAEPTADFHGLRQYVPEHEAQDGRGHESFQQGHNGSLLSRKPVKEGTKAQAQDAEKEEGHIPNVDVRVIKNKQLGWPKIAKSMCVVNIRSRQKGLKMLAFRPIMKE